MAKKKIVVRLVGKSNLKRDLERQAKLPGWRLSKNKKWYYENRRNRADVGKWS